jgi:hypothetical protein
MTFPLRRGGFRATRWVPPTHTGSMRPFVQRFGVSCLLLLLTGCGADKADDAPRYPISDMHGLTAGARWVYRLDDTGAVDSGRDAALEDTALVWAEHLGDGDVELRRGPSWGTGTDWGTLRFDISGADLLLAAWSLPTSDGSLVEGTGPLRLADAEAAHGDLHVTGPFQCETRVNEGARTFFGRFDDTVTLVCSGTDSQPTGRWTFGRGVGLVQLRGGTSAPLDLVAPGW